MRGEVGLVVEKNVELGEIEEIGEEREKKVVKRVVVLDV